VVVILGGGYGGVAAAKTLDATGDFFVILVDRKDYFLTNIASLRASLDDNVAKGSLVPYNKLLKHGVVLQADVEEVRATEVKLHGREEALQFEYLVIALGSSYAFPGKVAEPNILDAYLRYSAFNERVRRPEVQNIVVVGGGAVGVELVGELKDYLPKASVTLVHSGEKLISSERLKPEFLAGVNRQLKRLGVQVELGQRVEYPAADALPAGAEAGANSSYFWGLGSVSTSTGKNLPADLLLFTAGAKNNTRSLLASFGQVMKDERLIVNGAMQVQGYKHIFAVGDIAGTSTKRAYYAGLQGEIAAKNIIALVRNLSKPTPAVTPKLEEFKLPEGHVLVLTIGRQGGMTQFPNKGESVWGSTVSTMLKSKNLFIDKPWSDLNQKDAFNALQKSTNSKLQPEQVQFDVDAEKHAKQVEEAMKVLGIPLEQTKILLKQGLPAAQVDPNQQFV
jgi:NADH dehydrogenase FAD-containing subunit